MTQSGHSACLFAVLALGGPRTKITQDVGGPQLRCQLAKALALASMIFYAVLLPWHTVSQATAALAQADVASSQVSCHHALLQQSAPSKRSQPSRPPTNCPICKGFGTLHLAAGVPAILIVLGTSESEELPTLVVLGIADTNWRAPRSRGPPGLST
jgi:hypothetical protein